MGATRLRWLRLDEGTRAGAAAVTNPNSRTQIIYKISASEHREGSRVQVALEACSSPAPPAVAQEVAAETFVTNSRFSSLSLELRRSNRPISSPRLLGLDDEARVQKVPDERARRRCRPLVEDGTRRAIVA